LQKGKKYAEDGLGWTCVGDGMFLDARATDCQEDLGRGPLLALDLMQRIGKQKQGGLISQNQDLNT
jgi:hypothetical protein